MLFQIHIRFRIFHRCYISKSIISMMECGDFSEFQDVLKNMRKVDDLIVNTLNSVVPTASFNTDITEACKDLHKKLEEGNTQREAAIKKCVDITTDRVKRLRKQRENNNNDVQVSKALRSEQTKLRMLQLELGVEDLIKQRTSKVFNEKCRMYFKPE